MNATQLGLYDLSDEEEDVELEKQDLKKENTESQHFVDLLDIANQKNTKPPKKKKQKKKSKKTSPKIQTVYLKEKKEESSQTENSEYPPTAKIVSIKYQCLTGGNQLLKQHLKKCRDPKEGFLFDVLVSAKDRNGFWTTIKAHKCILAARSQYFQKLLSECVKSHDGKLDELSIEEYNYHIVEAYIEYLYSGNLFFTGDFSEWDKLIDLSSNDNFIPQMLYYKELYADFSRKLYTQIAQDLENFCNTKAFTDSKIEVLDEEGNVTKTFHTHLIFLYRSPHLTRTLNSGMKESISNTIQFQDVTADAIEVILKYLYTDRVTATPYNSVEVYIYANLFELPDLVYHCRKILIHELHVDNAVALLRIAEIYKDDFLMQASASFITNNMFIDDNEIKDCPNGLAKILKLRKNILRVAKRDYLKLYGKNQRLHQGPQTNFRSSLLNFNLKMLK